MALILLLVSGISHAVWNLLVKRAADRAAFLWWAQAIALCVYAPILALVTDLELPRAAWPPLLVSGVAEAGYVLALARAYDRGDLSLVYPVSRGAAPLLIAVGAAVLLGERLSPLGRLGVAAIAIGVAAVAAPSRTELRRALAGGPAVATALALLTAFFIAGYTVADKAALEHVSPFVYTLWAFVAMEVLLAPWLWLRRASAWAELRARWRMAALAGALTLGTALLVMVALTLATASYVGAVRGVSVVFAAALGWLVLGEEWGARRVVAAMIVAAGIACLSLAG